MEKNCLDERINNIIKTGLIHDFLHEYDHYEEDEDEGAEAEGEDINIIMNLPLKNNEPTVEAPEKIIVIDEDQLELINLTPNQIKTESKYFLLRILEDVIKYSSDYEFGIIPPTNTSPDVYDETDDNKFLSTATTIMQHKKL